MMSLPSVQRVGASPDLNHVLRASRNFRHCAETSERRGAASHHPGVASSLFPPAPRFRCDEVSAHPSLNRHARRAGVRGRVRAQRADWH